MATPSYVFGRIAQEREDDRRAGVARAGGRFRRPPYAAAYVAAARWTLDRAADDDLLDEMAMPITYLQRHSLELIIKDLLGVASDIDASRKHLDTGCHVEVAVPHDHVLQELAALLLQRLKAVGYDCPPEIVDLAKELSEFEDADETRTRYATGKPKGKYSKSSFPEEVVIPLRAWQERLESLHEHVLFRDVPPDPGQPHTLLEHLDREADSLFQALCHAGLL